MSFTIHIVDLEDGVWEPVVGPSINPQTATGYNIVKTQGGLCLHMCSEVPYAGWLAKNVFPLIWQVPWIAFHYKLVIDESTIVCAEVIETDAKITDSQGWTYDCSAQWDIAEDWMFQIDTAEGNWVDTGIKIKPLEPYEEEDIKIYYELDYISHKSRIFAVQAGARTYDVPQNLQWIPAKQVGWTPSQIVTQLQQVNNSKPGAYSLTFSKIGYLLDS